MGDEAQQGQEENGQGEVTQGEKTQGGEGQEVVIREVMVREESSCWRLVGAVALVALGTLGLVWAVQIGAQVVARIF